MDKSSRHKRGTAENRKPEHLPQAQSNGSSESARLFRLLADNAREMVSRHTADLTFLYVSPASVRVIGYPPEDLIGYRLDDLVHPDDLSSVLSAFAIAHDTDKTPNAIFRCHASDQTWRWCEIFCRGAVDSATGIEEIQATVRDVSKYKQIEKAIERVAKEWRGTFDSAQDAIMMLDRQANVIRVNLATLRLLKCEFRDLIGTPLIEVARKRLHLDDPFHVATAWADKRQVRTDLELEERSIWLRSTVDPILTEDGKIDGAVIFIADITTEKQAEKRLLRTLKEVRKLSSHLQTVREEERCSIAREVHDELGHTLTALKMDIAWLVKHIPDDDQDIASRGAELTGLVDQTISSVRRIVSRLRPPVLDDLGLDAALEWLAADFQRYSGIDTSVRLSDIPNRLRGANASCIFRIVQEALTNVSKHAGATHVSIHGEVQDATYHLVIQDDGQGFEFESTAHQPGFGLLGIAERVRDLDGEMDMNTAPGKGASLTITIPTAAIQ
ncbi:PAS domain-containing sensor histidine kinase [Wenzhouxiangella sp. EGI_FJ10305]|uniref:PAS domain-containing sensor histidine kinase n=1 Tax=Wenzhouxiangella sp. EGI_FJ10305 TaxID=3243768 RepID=UPI0035E27788